MKKRLSVLLVALMLATPMFAGVSNLSAMLVVTVEENASNSGIRITSDTENIMATFDSKFFAATDSIVIENPTLDGSVTEVTGKFSVLVRRISGLATDVSITAGPLANGDDVLEYTLEGTDVDVTITDTTVTEESYTIPAVPSGIIRHQNIITYTVPADNGARAGEYSANIIFEITT